MTYTGDRHILHMDLDTFFVSVERLINSSLVGKPVLIGGTGDRSVVAGCSYEARAFGVSSAMPMKLARQLCPQAIVLRGDMERYSQYSDTVTEILESKAPVVEKASIDEHYIDLSGMDRFFGCKKFSTELKELVKKETGLTLSWGLSLNKTVSKMATSESKPDGQKYIQQQMILPFLDPLSIKKIPMLGPQSFKKLRSMGIDTIYTLRNLPPELMMRVLGENGIHIWNKANGIDLAPVLPHRARKSISSERTFEQDTIDIPYIHRRITSMIHELAYQLRREHWLASCITVKIRYAGFDTHTQQMKIPYTQLDHLLHQRAMDLFTRLYNRRMLIRLVGIRLSHLVHGNEQPGLFDENPEYIYLYQAMDKIRNRFGKHAILPASVL